MLPVGSRTESVSIGGTERTYRLFVPPTLDPSRPAALVVMLHGGFGSARQAEAAYGWDETATRHGFVVAYPEGEGRAWNAGSCCGAPARERVDDVGFVAHVVADIGLTERIDPRRMFVTGMSNGAMMAQRLACETTLFAAMASVAGAQMVPCEGPTPISVLHIHGTADDHVPMDGSAGNGLGHVPAHTPVATSIDQWRSVDGCGSVDVVAHDVVTTSTAACPLGRAVTLVTIDGAGHQWPGSTKQRSNLGRAIGGDAPSTALDATRMIWDFFEAHPGPG